MLRWLLLGCVAWIGWLAAPQAAQTGEAPDSGVTGPLAELDWMAGRWSREDEGQYLEETWSPARTDAMVGVFRWARGGSVWLYELMSIEADGPDITFRLRHFSRGIEPWTSEADGPLTYPLKSMSENEVVFENPERNSPRRFIYRRTGDELEVRLETADGESDSFRLQLAR